MSVSKYDVEVDLSNKGTSHAMMVEMVGSNKRVLDVGCATGYLAKLFVAYGNTVAGIEYDADAAEVAREFADPVVVGDLEADPVFDGFDDGSFDVVVFGDVLEHLRDPLAVLRRARRLIAPGGSAVISVPNIAHGDVRLALLAGRFEYSNVGLLDVTHLHFFTRASLRTFLADAGLVALDIRTTQAALFSTELGVKEDEFSPAVVSDVRADPDATTYQFVVRVARDDALQIGADLAWRVDSLERDLADARSQVASAASHRVSAEQQQDEITALQEEVRSSAAKAAEAQAELDRINRTKTMRSARVARGIYGRLRRTS